MVKGGYIQKLLSVDLTKRDFGVEYLSEEDISYYIGGSALGSRILYNEAPRGINPLEPLNPLIFLTGPLTGTGAPGCCLYSVISKSPLTSGLGESDSQGFFGSELKFSGYDGIIVKGKSDKPVYIWINRGKPELRNAEHLWGKDTYETEDIIRKELEDPKIKVSCIGQAGENLSFMASIMNDKGHAAARGGLGAVMGSKLLKAVAVRGNNKVEIADSSSFKRFQREWRLKNKSSQMAQIISEYGTAGLIAVFNELGDLPVKNFSEGNFSHVERLSGQYMKKITRMKSVSCYSCHLSHNSKIEIDKGLYKGIYEAEPEYEGCDSLGANCLIDDITAIIKGNDLCNRYGLDIISVGGVIAFAMECYERGIITKSDTDGIELNFGNKEGMLKMIDKIAKKEGFGEVLADDVRTAANRIGKGSIDFAVHSDGMTIYMHDPRAGIGAGLAYAVTTGTDDVGGIFTLEWGGIDPELGYEASIDRFSTEDQALAVIKTQNKHIIIDAMGCCLFATMEVPLNIILKTFSAVTGIDIGLEEALKVGDRVVNLRRVFNIMNGIIPDDNDVLPKRLTHEAKSYGGAKDKVIDLKPMLEEYYELREWDKGVPKIELLKSLGLYDIAQDFDEYNK